MMVVVPAIILFVFDRDKFHNYLDFNWIVFIPLFLCCWFIAYRNIYFRMMRVGIKQERSSKNRW